MILERAGHVVVTASSESEALKACQENAFDVVILGQTVSPGLKRRTLATVREICSSAKVLELYNIATGKTLSDADEWLEVPTDVPPRLAERVTELAKGRG
jgi:PleD family two-component response regulator